MGSGTSKPAAQASPTSPKATQNASQGNESNTPGRTNAKVAMFWKRKFGDSESAPWEQFLEAYKKWLRETFPDVLDDEEFDNLMTEEAQKALKHVLCAKRGKVKTVSLASLSSAYPGGNDLFICTKQLISRAIRQFTQDLRSPGKDSKDNNHQDSDRSGSQADEDDGMEPEANLAGRLQAAAGSNTMKKTTTMNKTARAFSRKGPRVGDRVLEGVVGHAASNKLMLEGVEGTLAALSAHPHNPKVVEVATKAVCKLAFSTDMQVDIAARGVIPLVVDTLTNHPRNQEIINNSCTALWKLCLADVNRKEVGVMGGVQVLCTVLRDYIKSESVATRAVSALHQLTALEVNVQRFQAARGTELVKEVLKIHENCLAIQEDGVGLLAHITNEDSRSIVAQDDGIVLLLNVLMLNKDRRALQRDGLKVLQLLGEVAEYRDAIRMGGGLLVVLEAMGRFPMLTSIQVNSVNLLKVLAAGREERLMMKKMRCAYAIVTSMELYRIDDCPELHTDSMHTLRLMSTDQDIHESILEAGVIKMVIKTTYNFPDDLVTLRQCMTCLHNLCPTAECLAEILAQGGCEACAKVMHQYPDDQVLVEQGVVILTHMILSGDKEKVVAEGGDKVLLKALKKFQTNSRIQEMACMSLEQLDGTLDAGQLLSKDEDVRSLLATMRRYQDIFKIQSNSTSMLLKVSGNIDGQKMISDHGGVELMLRNMRTYVSEGIFQEKVCMIVQNLTTNEQILRKIGENGVLDVLGPPMKAHPKLRKLQVAACGIVGRLCRLEDAPYLDQVTRAKDLGTIPFLMEAAKNNPGQVELQKNVLHMLSRWARYPAQDNWQHADRHVNEENALQYVLGRNNGLLVASMGMRAMLDKFETQVDAASATNSLTVSNKSHVQAARLGVIPLAARALRAYPHEVALAREACGILGNVCAYEDNIALVADIKDTLPLTVEVMSRFPDDLRLQINALRLLCRVSFSPFCRLVHQAGALPHIINAMNSIKDDPHPRYLILQEVAVFTLWQLVGTLHLEDDVFKLNGGAAVIRELMHYRGHAKFQERGWFVLNAIGRLPHAQGPLFDLGVPEKSMVVMAQYQKSEDSNGDPHVFTEACETFAYIADHPPNQPFLANEEMVKYIIRTMDDNLHLPRVQAACARALSNLAAHNHNTTHLLHMGGVELVVRELESFPFDDNVQLNSMRTLRSLAVGRENLDYLLQKGAAGLAVHAMQTHMHEVALLRIGAGILHDMSTLMRHRRLIARSGALECLVNAVRMYPTDRDLVQNSLACFWNLCIGTQETAIHLFSEGVVQLAVAEMRLFRNDVGVLADAMAVLWTVAIDEEMQKTVASCGGMEFVIRTMKNCPVDLPIQQHAFALLSRTSALATDLIRELGALPLVMYGMQRFPKDAWLQEEACKTVAHMARDPVCCEMLGTLGGLSLVLLAMRSFPIRDRHEPANGGRPELHGVQGAACAALKTVLRCVGGQLPEAADGVMDAVIGAVEANMDDAQLMHNALGVLTQLCEKQSNVESFTARDGISMVIDTMRAFTANRAVLLCCLELLHPALNDTNRTLAMIMGVFGIIQQVLRAFVDDKDIQLAGLKALGNLAQDTGNKVLLMRSGVLGLIANSIGSAAESGAELNCAVCHLLNELIAYKPNLQVVLQESGVVSYVVEAMMTYRDHASLQEAACGVITKIHCAGGLEPWCAHVETELFQVLQLVLAAMQCHPENAGLAGFGTTVAELFTVAEDMRELAAGFGTGKLVCKATAKFPGIEKVQESGLGALANLARDEENHPELYENNALEPVMKAMIAYPKNLQVQQCACNLISTLGGDSVECRGLLRNNNAIYHIIAAMGAFRPAARLQAEACAALAALTDEEWEAEDRAFIGANSGIRLIVAAMQAHPLEDVQLEAFLALTTLSVDPDNASRYMRDSGPFLLHQALERYQTMPAMVTAAASLIAQLGLVKDHAITLGVEGFRPVLLKSIRHFPGDEEVQRACWAAMQPITASTQRQVVEFEQENGVADLMEALEKFPDNTKMWECCVGVLRSAIACPDLHPNLVAAGSIDLVVHALGYVTHQQSYVLAVEGITFLRDLILCNAAAGVEMRREVMDLKGDQKVADAMGRFPRDEHLKEIGMDALKLLASPLHSQLAVASKFKIRTSNNENSK